MDEMVRSMTPLKLSLCSWLHVQFIQNSLKSQHTKHDVGYHCSQCITSNFTNSDYWPEYANQLRMTGLVLSTCDGSARRWAAAGRGWDGARSRDHGRRSQPVMIGMPSSCSRLVVLFTCKMACMPSSGAMLRSQRDDRCWTPGHGSYLSLPKNVHNHRLQNA
jgi:hypothetical protein